MNHNYNLILTPTVVQKAKDYFGCPSLIGLELEDQEGYQISSHWDARILLGEYMNAKQYSPEVVMSDFTLALLEDSGWYKVNYYTGGLMRFGKNKGCAFLDDECSENGITKFKNEFFDYSDRDKPSCSSGRLSRAYCEDNNNNYADKCYIFDNKEDKEIKPVNNINEEIEDIYVGNCKRGNGNYGSKIEYNNLKKFKNSELSSILKEVYSNNSFCILSEAYPTSSSTYSSDLSGVIHPICYEMSCSDNSLTVKIGEQYVVCPRKGGKIQVFGDFQGYIYCPDFNLICTGTPLCNDMFDCINKLSLPKTQNYDYEMSNYTSSQKIIDLKNMNPDEGYEADDTNINAKCPKNCAQCKEDKKCFLCRQGYNLIGEKENDNKPIKCDNQIDISNGYYKKGEVYYQCVEYCVTCNNGDYCQKCDNFHKLDKNSKCEEKIANCENYNITDYSCLKCKNGYGFIKTDRENCRTIDYERYYSDDGGISYYPCDTNINYCDKCIRGDSCEKCIKNYFFIETNRTKCYSNRDFNLLELYTEDNATSYYFCDKAILQCQYCYNKNFCYNCKYSYFLKFNDNSECFLEDELKKDQLYYKFNSTHYKKCSDNIENCKNCTSGDKCIQCLQNYYFLNDNYKKCVDIRTIDNDEYYKVDPYNYHQCSWKFRNCKKCNSTICKFCNNDYTLVNDNYEICYSKDSVQKGYYQNAEGNMYYPCINNCDKCVNGDECIECAPKFFLLGDGTSCGSCMYVEQTVKDELTMVNLDKLKESYINKYKNNFDVVAVYANPTLNYTYIVFRTWQCTEILIAEKYFKIDLSQFLEKLKKN